MFQHLAPHQPICARMPSPTTRCAPPRRGFHNGTVSITSIGGVASTFVLKWLKALQNAHHKQLECEESSSSSAGSCSCPAIGAHTLPRQVVSCHVDDDGVFKHLADPRALNRFPHHRAVYIVGDPLHAVTSVFRRNFQCWHLYRLHNCWFSRAQREGVIPCAQPGIQSFRRRFGAAASKCRVPPAGPLSSLEAYAAQGEDLFAKVAQFRAWLSCRAPECRFDILVLRYETLNVSTRALFDFLELPPAVRASFPAVEYESHERHAARLAPATREKLEAVYGGLAEAVAAIPPGGLLLQNAGVS